MSLQRDAYAALYRNTRTEKMTVDILQVNGVVMRERLSSLSFCGHRNRRIVLMTHLAGSGKAALLRPPAQQPARVSCNNYNYYNNNAAAVPLTHDIVVPDFTTLKRIHRPQLVYKLLPLRCTSCDTFVLLQTLCASPHSPFTIDDRHEPQELTQRLLYGCSGRSQLSAFFYNQMTSAERDVPATSQRLPVSRVCFDGLLVKHARCNSSNSNSNSSNNKAGAASLTRTQGSMVSAAVLVTMHDALSEKVVMERALMRDYFASPLYAQLTSNTELRMVLQRTQHIVHVMGVLRSPMTSGSVMTAATSAAATTATATMTTAGADAAPRQRALVLARERKLHVYERTSDGTFVYANG